MEHILQFAVSIDDDRIEKIAIDKASEMFLNEFKEKIYDGRYYGFSNETKAVIREAVNEYRDQIIKEASRMVADSIRRSNQYKALVGDLEGMVKSEGEEE